MVDEINDELSRIVQFMNMCGSPNFDFAALEMRRFQAEKAEMLMPRVFGPAHVAKSRATGEPGKQWDEATFFEELLRRHGPEAAKVARRILEWFKPKTRIYWGKGKRSGSFVPILDRSDFSHQLFAVYTYGVVEIYFYWFSFKPPFDTEQKRLELLAKLNQIEGVSIPQDAINRRPSISLSALAKGAIVEQFLAIYDWVLEEIRSTPVNSNP